MVQKKISEKINASEFLIIAIGLLSLIPFIYLAKYTFPFSDDYYFITLQNKDSFLSTWIAMYFNYNGRYSASFFQLLIPSIKNSLILYRLFGVIIILFLNILLFKVLNRIGYSKKDSFVLTLAFITILIYQFSTTAQGFYWYSSSTAYTIPIIITLLQFLILLKIEKTTNQYIKTIFQIISGVGFMILAGFNESICIASFTILFFIYIYKQFVNKKVQWFWLYLFLCSLIGFAVVIFSPGNISREATEMGGRFTLDISFISLGLAKSVIAALSFTLKWLNSPIIPITIIVLPNLTNLKINKITTIIKIPTIYIILVFIAVLIGSFLPSILILGNLPWQRIQNVIYFLFLCFWFLITFVLYLKYLQSKVQINSFVRYILIIHIFFSLKNSNTSTNNIGTAYSDILSDNAKNYQLQMNNRTKIILNSKGPIIGLSPINNPPLSIFPGDITTEFNDFSNVALDSFYDNKQIYLKN